MTSSGTYSFAPNFGDLSLNAFGRIGIRRSELTQQHLADAALESNLVQVEISNLQPNLWLAELYTVSLVEGTATYALPARLISPMSVYLTTTDTSGNSVDRILFPLSSYEYSALPNKEQQAAVTSYWFQRNITPQVNVWPVPDGNATYTLNLRILSQPEDASIPNGVTPNLPYRWMDCFTAKLAHRLARIYRPELESVRKADAMEAWQNAAKEDIEYVNMYFMPGLGNYYR
jgi:hypothetical protein